MASAACPRDARHPPVAPPPSRGQTPEDIHPDEVPALAFGLIEIAADRARIACEEAFRCARAWLRVRDHLSEAGVKAYAEYARAWRKANRSVDLFDETVRELSEFV